MPVVAAHSYPMRVIHMIIYFKLIKAWPAVMRRGRPDDHGRE